MSFVFQSSQLDFQIFVRDTSKLAQFENNASRRSVVNLRRCSLFLYHYGNLM